LIAKDVGTFPLGQRLSVPRNSLRHDPLQVLLLGLRLLLIDVDSDLLEGLGCLLANLVDLLGRLLLHLLDSPLKFIDLGFRICLSTGSIAARLSPSSESSHLSSKGLVSPMIEPFSIYNPVGSLVKWRGSCQERRTLSSSWSFVFLSLCNDCWQIPKRPERCEQSQ